MLQMWRENGLTLHSDARSLKYISKDSKMGLQTLNNPHKQVAILGQMANEAPFHFISFNFKLNFYWFIFLTSLQKKQQTNKQKNAVRAAA